MAERHHSPVPASSVCQEMNFSTVSAMAGATAPIVTKTAAAVLSASFFILFVMVSSSKKPNQMRSIRPSAASDGLTPSPGPEGR